MADEAGNVRNGRIPARFCTLAGSESSESNNNTDSRVPHLPANRWPADNGDFAMARRLLLCVSMWLTLLTSASQAGIIFHRNRQPAAQPDQVAGLLQTLRSDADEHHRVTAAESLAKIDPNSNPGIMPALEEAALNDASQQVRIAARAALNHIQGSAPKNGHAPGGVPQTAEPPLATPTAPPRNAPSSTTIKPAPVSPRVTSRPVVRESTEPPLAASMQTQTSTPPAARPTPPVIARTQDMPATTTAPRPIVIKSEPGATWAPVPVGPAPKPIPVVRPPVVVAPATPSVEPPHATPVIPAIPVKATPAKPEEDGPVLNPPG
jgi:hypothetical protein